MNEIEYSNERFFEDLECVAFAQQAVLGAAFVERLRVAYHHVRFCVALLHRRMVLGASHVLVEVL